MNFFFVSRTGTLHRDGAMPPRFTDLINPEHTASTNSPDDHVYSTLDQTKPHSLLPQDVETSFTSKNSPAFDDTDTKLPFQIIQEGIPGPEPYELAVSSRENIFSPNDVPNSVETRRVSNISAGSGYNQSPRLNCAQSKGVLLSSQGPEYTQIKRQHRHKEVSPRLPDRDSRGGKAMDMRVSSAGHLRGVPPRTFKKHMSATENTRRDSYEHLNRGQTCVPANQRGRGKSLSSLTQPPQLHQLDNHYSLTSYNKNSQSPTFSLTNYNKSSQSPTELQNPSTELQNPSSLATAQSFDPSTTSELLPSSLSSSLPFSPSGTSLMENGAYETIKPVNSSLSVLWYQNSDDSSLNEQQQQQQRQQEQQEYDDVNVWANSTIAPYSQVSNFEIDSRRLEESLAMEEEEATRSRFFIVENTPLPYSEAMKSSVGSSSQLHQISAV